MRRAYVAYYRVSTKSQGASGLGLEGQQMAVRDFLEANPGEMIAEVSEIESGRKSDRPKLKEALRLCRVYSATLVIARLDRLARSVGLVSRLMESGAEFVAADFPMANHFTIHIFAAVAEYELKLMSERQKAARAAEKARGARPAEQLRGKFVYRPGHLDAARAAQLERCRRRAVAMAPLLVELRDSGKYLFGIATELTRMEIETPKNAARWNSEAVRRLFHWADLASPLKGAGNRRVQTSLNGRPMPRRGVVSLPSSAC
jgi:DNA invertase Pin-like site-specific DNA recombinase